MSVEIENITKSYGQRKAVDSVSFSVGQGELIGLLGPNGAGKSTLMKIITGFLPPDSGQATINGTPVSTRTAATRKLIGYLPENNPLYTDLFVKESLDITAGFYGIKNRRKRVDELVELTGLTVESHKKIGALSKGYRQRVGLAQALIHDPSVLILDEPTTGLDPNQLEEIRRLIREISRDKTVILSSHIMQEVEAMCSRAIIIHNGRIVADGDLENLKKNNIASNRIVIAEFSGKVEKVSLEKIGGVVNATFENGKWLIEAEPQKDIRPDIFRFAVANDLMLLTLQENILGLENVFQKLTR